MTYNPNALDHARREALRLLAGEMRRDDRMPVEELADRIRSICEKKLHRGPAKTKHGVRVVDPFPESV